MNNYSKIILARFNDFIIFVIAEKKYGAVLSACNQRNKPLPHEWAYSRVGSKPGNRKEVYSGNSHTGESIDRCAPEIDTRRISCYPASLPPPADGKEPVGLVGARHTLSLPLLVSQSVLLYDACSTLPLELAYGFRVSRKRKSRDGGLLRQLLWVARMIETPFMVRYGYGQTVIYVMIPVAEDRESAEGRQGKARLPLHFCIPSDRQQRNMEASFTRPCVASYPKIT